MTYRDTEYLESVNVTLYVTNLWWPLTIEAVNNKDVSLAITTLWRPITVEAVNNKDVFIIQKEVDNW